MQPTKKQQKKNTPRTTWDFNTTLPSGLGETANPELSQVELKRVARCQAHGQTAHSPDSERDGKKEKDTVQHIGWAVHNLDGPPVLLRLEVQGGQVVGRGVKGTEIPPGLMPKGRQEVNVALTEGHSGKQAAMIAEGLTKGRGRVASCSGKNTQSLEELEMEVHNALSGLEEQTHEVIQLVAAGVSQAQDLADTLNQGVENVKGCCAVTKTANCAGGRMDPENSQYLRSIMNPERYQGRIPDLSYTPVVQKMLNTNLTYTTGGNQDLLFVLLPHSTTPRVTVYSAVTTASANTAVGQFLPVLVCYPEEDVALSYTHIRMVSAITKIDLVMAYGGNTAVTGQFIPVEVANPPPLRTCQASKAHAYATSGLREGPFRVDRGVAALSCPRNVPPYLATPQPTLLGVTQQVGGNAAWSTSLDKARVIHFTSLATNWAGGIPITPGTTLFSWTPDSYASAGSPAALNMTGPVHFNGNFAVQYTATASAQVQLQFRLRVITARCNSAGVASETTTDFQIGSVTDSSGTVVSTVQATLSFNQLIQFPLDSTVVSVLIQASSQTGVSALTFPNPAPANLVVTSYMNDDLSGNINMIFGTGMSPGLPLNLELAINLEAAPNNTTAAQVKVDSYVPPNLLESQMVDYVFANREQSGVVLFYSTDDYNTKVRSGWMEQRTTPEALYAHTAGFITDIWNFLKPGLRAMVPGTSRLISGAIGRPDLEASLNNLGKQAFTKNHQEGEPKIARCMDPGGGDAEEDLDAFLGGASPAPQLAPSKPRPKLAKLKAGSKDPNSSAILTHVQAGTVDAYYQASMEKFGLVTVQNHFPGLDAENVELFTVAVSTAPYPEQDYTTVQGGDQGRTINLNTLAATNATSIIQVAESFAETSLTAFLGEIYVTIVTDSGFQGIAEDSFSLAFAACLVGCPVEAVLTGLVSNDGSVTIPGGLGRKAALAKKLSLPLVTGPYSEGRWCNGILSVRSRRVDLGKVIYATSEIFDLMTIIGFVNRRVAVDPKQGMALPMTEDRVKQKSGTNEPPPLRTDVVVPITIRLGPPDSWGGPPGSPHDFEISQPADVEALRALLASNKSGNQVNFSAKNFMARVSFNSDDEPITPTSSNKKVVYYGLGWKESLKNTIGAFLRGLKDAAKKKGPGAQQSKAKVNTAAKWAEIDEGFFD